MDIGNYIKKGKKFENMNQTEILHDADYLKWMNEIKYYCDVNLKNHPLKESIDNCYFFRNSPSRNSFKEIMGILEICDEQKEVGGEKMGNLKFFISHSTKDKKLVNDFIFFLREGLDIKKSEVFCTSLNNALPIGSEFIPVMKEKIGECNQVVFLITENYLKSKFCLAEMGAAWALNQKIIPIIVSPIDYSNLDDTPLKGTQMIKLNEEEDLYKLTTQLVQEQLVGVEAFADVRKNMDKFLNNFNS